MPDKEKSELEKAMQTAKKAAAGIPPEAMKAAAAAQQQAAEISPEAAQTAQEVQKVTAAIPDDLQEYTELIINATSYPEMSEDERKAYLKSVAATNARLKQSAPKLRQLVNGELLTKSELTRYLYNGVLPSLYDLLESLLAFYQSDTWTALTEIFPDTQEAFKMLQVQQESIIDIYNLYAFCEQLEAAKPFIAEELEAYKKKSGVDSVSFAVFIREILPRCLERTEQVQQAQDAPRINTEKVTTLQYPIDKVNNSIWRQLSGDARQKDGYFHIAVEKDGSKNNIDIIYNIDFTEKEKQLNAELETAGKDAVPALTARTKRVMIAANELYKHGSIFSRTQLYHAMGYKGRPGAKDLEAIEKDLDLLLSPIKIDNRQEVEAGYKYTRFKYDGALMPHERIAAWIDGVLTIDAIHLFRQPPLMEFAESRDNITTISVNLLDSPKSKTVSNLTIEDYLIRRIARMKKSNAKSSRKILYETVYKNCGIEDRLQKYRARETVSVFLKHYKEQGYIKGFSVAKKKDGVNIRF